MTLKYTKAPRVGFYHPYPHRMGGSQVVTLLLARYLPAVGYEPVLICPEEGNLTTTARQQGIEALTCTPPDSWRIYGKGASGPGRWLSWRHGADLLHYWRVLKIFLETHRIDLLHCHDVRAVVMAAPAGRLARIPTLWHVHGGPTQGWSQWLDPILALIAKDTVFVSNGMLDYWRIPKKLLGRRRVIHNGFNAPTSGPSSKHSNPAPLLLVVGVLHPRKGHDRLLAALPEISKQYSNIQCCFVGRDWADGSWEANLRHRATELGLDPYVTFLGQRSDVLELMSRSYCLIVPSRSEPFGMVALEAMALGKPVVAANTGGLRDIVVHEETGLLVDADDSSALADAITRVLRDRPLAQRMGEAGRKRATIFSTETMASRFAALYAELLGQIPRLRTH